MACAPAGTVKATKKIHNRALIPVGLTPVIKKTPKRMLQVPSVTHLVDA